MITRHIGILILAATLAGCATQADRQAMRQHNLESYIESNDRPEAISEALRANELIKGMKFEDVAALWGPPRRVNRASYGSQAVWSQHCPYSRDMFQENIYVYFEGDTVTGWQRNDCIN